VCNHVYGQRQLQSTIKGIQQKAATFKLIMIQVGIIYMKISKESMQIRVSKKKSLQIWTPTICFANSLCLKVINLCWYESLILLFIASILIDDGETSPPNYACSKKDL
jgi:hypothetical protein